MSVTEAPDSALIQRVLYPISDAAVNLGIGRTKLFELIAGGEIQTVTIGRRRLIPRDSLLEFVERLRAEGE
jgi:excisionase family DNA binding protein